MEIISSAENIKLAYRNLKKNEGSKTAEQHLKSYAATFQKGLDDSNEEMGKY